MLLEQKLLKQDVRTNKRKIVVRTKAVRIKVMAPIKTRANSHK
jgi:hypothetical protein